MEGIGILKKNPVNIAHLPTLMVAIGFPVYWAEMYAGAGKGVTSPVAVWLFTFFVVFVLFREREAIGSGFKDFTQWFIHLDKSARVLYALIFAFIAVILAVTLYASLFPPHLIQESDTMHYHYSLTRQHLLIGSFERIPWSGFDLFLLPVDYALAPYWFATELPNKFPQFISFLGLAAVLMSLARHGSKEGWGAAVLAAAFLFGSHGHGIQMGTAMLDLTNAYLFFAAVDSFLKRAKWLFIIEANFFLWSKSFVPIQMLAVGLALVVLVLVLRKLSFKQTLWDFKNPAGQGHGRFLRECAAGFIALAILTAGPFMTKSMAFAGTPVYPFGMGMFHHPQTVEGSVVWNSLKGMADYVGDTVLGNYGYGRSPVDFLKHFWLIAVPEKGVNNAFDYPLGLTYLLTIGPFFYFLFQSLREKKVPLLALFVLIMWGSWWFGSQQSRWLYIPLLIIFVTTAVRLSKPPKVLLVCVVAALALNSASIIRAHRGDFSKTRLEVLRPQDRDLVEQSEIYLREGRSDMVDLTVHEVAFARFPVAVRKESLPNVLAF